VNSMISPESFVILTGTFAVVVTGENVSGEMLG
jgi:hypothetical protein